MRNDKLIFNLYQIYKYLVFFPLLGISTTILFIMIFIFLFAASERFVQLGGILWARFNSFITPMFVKISGVEHIDKNQSYVVVANHQSQYDIFLMYGWLPIDFRWVMKMELRKVPIIGYYCYKAGHIFIDRSDSRSAIETINRAKGKIKDGTSVVFFPEGTRSESGELLKFKKGAFKFAVDMGLPILPVTIAGTRDILPANSTALFPGSAEMIIHSPIACTGGTDDGIGELVDKSTLAIRKGLEEYHARKANA